jgi:hypothetical protein
MRRGPRRSRAPDRSRRARHILILEDLSGAHWPPEDLRGGWRTVVENPEAAGVRAIQRAQLAVALPWAARELGLSRPRPR